MNFNKLKTGDPIWIKDPELTGKWQRLTVNGTDQVPESKDTPKHLSISTDYSKQPIRVNGNGDNGLSVSELGWKGIILVSANDPEASGLDTEQGECGFLRMLQSIKVVNLKKKEPLPKERTIIVGMSNHEWHCLDFIGMEYTRHHSEQNSYGGYFYHPSGRNSTWWTMNANYEPFTNDVMFIVPDHQTGDRLVKMLNLIGNDIRKVNDSLARRLDEIERLQREVEAIKKYSGAILGMLPKN